MCRDGMGWDSRIGVDSVSYRSEGLERWGERECERGGGRERERERCSLVGSTMPTPQVSLSPKPLRQSSPCENGRQHFTEHAHPAAAIAASPVSTPHSLPNSSLDAQFLTPHPIHRSTPNFSHHIQRTRRARIPLPHKPQAPRDLPGPGAHIHIPPPQPRSLKPVKRLLLRRLRRRNRPVKQRTRISLTHALIPDELPRLDEFHLHVQAHRAHLSRNLLS